MTARTTRLLLVLSLLAASLTAAPERALKVPVGQADKLVPQAAFLAALLKSGGTAYFRLPSGGGTSRGSQGQWQSDALQAALRSQGSLAVSGNIDAAGSGLNVDIEPLSGEDGRWASAVGLPAITLIEDRSTVGSLSKGLKSWNWPYQSLSYAQVESDPSGTLDPSRCDVAIFSSPGWWNDEVNPPSGPSGMSKPVAEALREFVRHGGTAIFIDIAQWDLEKAWPKSLNLSPLGPYGVSKLNLEGGPSGGAVLAPVGVAADSLRAKGAFGLLGGRAFAFPDGVSRQLYAAYAMPDPGGGQGWIAGLALHVFEQDEALAARIRRLLMNMLLLSGSRRLSVPGEPASPIPPTKLPPIPLATAATTALPPAPEPTVMPPLQPSPLPTTRPTGLAVPAIPAGGLPTPFPTQVIKPLPTFAPLPTWVPPTLGPAPTPMPTPAPRFMFSPTALPTRAPTPPPPTVLLRVPTPSSVHARTASAASTVKALATVQPSPVPTRYQGPETKLQDGVKNSLGCLSSAPEPFADGGVYLQFCLKRMAKVDVNVFDAQGRPLWHNPAVSLSAGNHQVFFDGRVHGRLIVPGRYLWQVRAEYTAGSAESRQGSLTRRAASHRP